ncbi:MAG: hypothetical protein GTO51_08155 [Candidatus Latescibacteria bacterium]|nr:hypothetical protein [Candidatus Latescibacterota bacterium]NIM21807.1 hypothetical protein [Candidatus Latescibacterota bacterium]NIM65945.1 hypothetical protein [Candidatus Latescibacterota bacterium]NIO02690.1 hypothetical protein [Candidatus Latescibacterota bacterium]NIO29671.1 hypothetical protein [Candidatus Latescibacterota bacterium]
MKDKMLSNSHLKAIIGAFTWILLLPSLSWSGGFSTNPLWDDGLAEVAVYDAKARIYNRLWDHEMVLVTVKEDFSKEQYTKADPPYHGKDLLPVIKLNMFTRIQTFNYPYHFLVSLFVEKNDAFIPVKMTVGSQEWCGNTFVEFKNWVRPASFVYHSYFDGQGNGEVSIDFNQGDMLREQLFISLRDIPFRKGYRRTFRLLNSQMSNYFRDPIWHESELVVVGEEEVETSKEQVLSWRIDVTNSTEQVTLWFDKNFPHPLVKYVDSSGQEMVLKEISRSAYWEP